MVAIHYWHNRLAVGKLLANQSSYVRDFDYRFTDNIDWPLSVARSCLYDDYYHWTAARGLEPDNQSTFFKTLANYIYITEKRKTQIFNARVRTTKYARGRLVMIKVSRYFIRLRPLEEHIKRYEDKTGLKISRPSNVLTGTADRGIVADVSTGGTP